MRIRDIVEGITNVKEFDIKIPDENDTMGVPREKMPQIHQADYDEYFQYLKDNGVDFVEKKMPASALKATQGEFSKKGVEKQLDKNLDAGGENTKPMIASNDNYIIDGHHRWLAALNTRGNVNVIQASVPMRKLMDLTLKFPKVYFKKIYEGYKLHLERDPNMYVLHITDTKSGKRTEVRGKSGYESGSYDADDKLHQLLDKIGKSANISELINGEVVTINPKHPDAEKAKAATDVAFNEDVEVDLHGNAERGYVLSKIEVPKDQRGQGVGSRIMQQIIDRMDKEGAVIALTPDSVFGGSKSKLIDFYKRFGFVPNKGRNKDFRFRETMIRYPKQINEAFVKPQFDVEWEEAERYPEFVKIGKEAWIELASKGKAVTITDASDINNTDAADPNSFKLLDPAKQKRALAQLEKGSIEMPIVAVYSDGWKELIGGNTRLTAMMARDGKATVWVFKVPDSILENFADGKVKGKSKPGRVKAAGASCKGSVTDLRAKAKKYSGERGKMYHWCANMKAGKQK